MKLKEFEIFFWFTLIQVICEIIVVILNHPAVNNIKFVDFQSMNKLINTFITIIIVVSVHFLIVFKDINIRS